MANDNGLMQRLLAIFADESREHLEAVAAGLIELETVEDDKRRHELIEILYREIHSLKGAARSVDLAEIETRCQDVEDDFAKLKAGKIALTQDLFDQLNTAMRDVEKAVNKTTGYSEKMVSSPIPAEAPSPSVPQSALPPSGTPENRAEPEPRERHIPASSVTAVPAESATPPPAPVSPRGETVQPAAGEVDGAETGGTTPRGPMTGGTVRIEVGLLDSLLRQAEELLQIKMSLLERERMVHRLADDIEQWQHDVALGKPRSLPSDVIAQLNDLRRRTGADRRLAGNLIDELLDNVKQAMMMPFSTIMVPLQKAARDLARQEGKLVHCEVQGADVEMDKRLLEALRNPLMHLVRNCVDHGIETPDRRQAAGKPERGHIAITIRPLDDSTVEIDLRDDGAGIDPNRLRDVAINKGNVSSERADALTAENPLALIFESGVTTSPIVTTVSGRGLGMAIVRDTVEAFGGSVAVNSQPGVGTEFQLRLPVTVSTYRGVFVEAGGETLVLPTRDLVCVMRVPRDHVTTVENRPSVLVNGKATSLIGLAELLGLPPGPAVGADMLSIAVVRTGAGTVGLLVDSVLADQEILAKGLGPQLVHVPNISGAATLPDGTLALILNNDEIIRAVASGAGGGALYAVEGDNAAGKATGPRRVLLVEDSITARLLLQSILEGAGYDVITAVDGADAFATLRTEAVDIVVSDVDMPRMDGFALTARIRDTEDCAKLPVILVTARETREDRERGIEVGADAYVAKSTFEQNNLLEIMARLV